MARKLRSFSRVSNISDTIPMERHESFVVKDGMGRGIERWEVTSIGRYEDNRRYFVADITEIHPFYN